MGGASVSRCCLGIGAVRGGKPLNQILPLFKVRPRPTQMEQTRTLKFLLLPHFPPEVPEFDMAWPPTSSVQSSTCFVLSGVYAGVSCLRLSPAKHAQMNSGYT